MRNVQPRRTTSTCSHSVPRLHICNDWERINHQVEMDNSAMVVWALFDRNCLILTRPRNEQVDNTPKHANLINAFRPSHLSANPSLYQFTHSHTKRTKKESEWSFYPVSCKRDATRNCAFYIPFGFTFGSLCCCSQFLKSQRSNGMFFLVKDM